MTFRWDKGNDSYSGASEDGEDSSSVRIEIKADSLGSQHFNALKHCIIYLSQETTVSMSAMLTILLESRTARFKHKVKLGKKSGIEKLIIFSFS